MSKTQTIIIFLLSFLSFSCKSEGTGGMGKYKVDESLKKEVERNIGDMNGFPVGSLELKIYENDVLTFDNFGDDEKGELLFMTSYQGDTMCIIGFAGFTVALGFYLDLYGDNYELTYMVKSDAEIYKYNEDDERASYKLSVPCSYTSCILTSKPTFTKGDVVSGVVELKSNDFWDLANGRKNKYRVELKAYFQASEVDFGL
ncbi:MAG: hypothetical protein LBV72_17355 [Tannerella sp.]|jgi:hypothetical protein|nr:hypothetical protein [Tannerella sp.]